MYLGDEYELDPEGEGVDSIHVADSIASRDALLFPPSEFIDEGTSTTSYECPYCGGEGFNEQQLLVHVTDLHASDPKSVVRTQPVQTRPLAHVAIGLPYLCCSTRR